MNKSRAISLLMLLIFALSACSIKTDSEVSSLQTEQPPERVDERELNKVTEFGRYAVSELQKMMDGSGDISFNTYDEAFEYFGINEHEKGEFIKVSRSKEHPGYLKSIIFQPSSEVVYKRGDQYIYQITTITTRKEYSEKITLLNTYELEIERKTLGSFIIKTFTYYPGGSLNGTKYIAANAIDDITKERLDVLIKNLLGIDIYNEEEALHSINFAVQNNEIINELKEDFPFKGELGRTFIQSSIEVLTSDINDENLTLSVKGKYVIKSKDKNEEINYESFDFSIVLAQKNPNANIYTYIISDITLKKSL